MITSWSSRVRAVLALAVALGATVATLAAPASAAAAAPLTTFNIRLYSSCVSGVGNPNSPLSLTLKSSTGQFQGKFRVTTQNDGYWSDCFWGDVDPGDQIFATNGTRTRTYLVQRMSYTVNRVTNVIAGTSVANSAVDLSVMSCNGIFGGCTSAADVQRPTSSTGAFSYDFTGTYDIIGADYTQVHWMSASGDDQYQSLYAPYLATWMGNNFAWGIGNLDAPVTVRLLNSSNVLKAKLRDRSDYDDGYFERVFRKDGAAVNVTFGDTLVSNIATDAQLKVINYQPHFNVAGNTITGHCFANAPFALYLQNIDTNYSNSTDGNTDANGQFTVDTMADFGWDLKVGDLADVECRNARGDMLEETFQVVNN